MIGNDIIVAITGIFANQVKIGISAPKDVPILREELLPLARNAGEGEIS